MDAGMNVAAAERRTLLSDIKDAGDVGEGLADRAQKLAERLGMQTSQFASLIGTGFVESDSGAPGAPEYPPMTEGPIGVALSSVGHQQERLRLFLSRIDDSIDKLDHILNCLAPANCLVMGE